MKKFVFRLATLMRVKEGVKKQQELELQKARDELFVKIQELDQLNEERTLMKTRFHSDINNGNVQVYRLAQYSHYLEYLKERTEAKQIEIAEAQKKVDACTEALIVTLNELKVLQNLHDKQYAEYQAQAASESEKEIGDMLSYRMAKESRKQ